MPYRSNIILLFFLSVAELCSAQETGLVAHIDNVLIIPYEEVMFVSDLDSNQVAKMGYSMAEFTHQLQASVLECFGNTARSFFDPVLLPNDNDTLNQKALKKISWGIQRSYQAIPPVKNSEILVPESVPNVPDSALVMSNVFMDKFDRYLQTRIYDLALTKYLAENFDCDYFLFLSQVELICNEDKRSAYDPTTDCWLLIHYTFLNASGTIQTGGIARVPFNQTQIDMNYIEEKMLPTAANLVWWKITNQIY